MRNYLQKKIKDMNLFFLYISMFHGVLVVMLQCSGQLALNNIPQVSKCV